MSLNKPKRAQINLNEPKEAKIGLNEPKQNSKDSK